MKKMKNSPTIIITLVILLLVSCQNENKEGNKSTTETEKEAPTEITISNDYEGLVE